MDGWLEEWELRVEKGEGRGGKLETALLTLGFRVGVKNVYPTKNLIETYTHEAVAGFLLHQG